MFISPLHFFFKWSINVLCTPSPTPWGQQCFPHNTVINPFTYFPSLFAFYIMYIARRTLIVLLHKNNIFCHLFQNTEAITMKILYILFQRYIFHAIVYVLQTVHMIMCIKIHILLSMPICVHINICICLILKINLLLIWVHTQVIRCIFLNNVLKLSVLLT